MEQTVAEKPFSQEHHASQLHTWRNGPEGSRGFYPLQDSSQSRDPRRWTGWDRSNMSSGSFNGEEAREDKSRAPVCRDNLRGKCTRGSFCKYLHQHSGFVDHDGATFFRNDKRNLDPVVDPINSQLFSENKDGDSSRRPLIGESRSRSPCRNYQSGRCYRGSTCRYLHPEFTKYSETNVGDSSRRSFFREGRKRSPCRKFQSGRCDRGSTCPYLHSEFAESDRPIHDWNAEQYHGEAASRNCRFHEEIVDNNLNTSQVHDAANKENNSRFSFSRELRSRSPCRNFLQGRCHRGASCRRSHPVNAYNNWSAEQQPRVTGNSNNHGSAYERSALSSREHIEANQQNNLWTASFSGEPRSRAPCQYSHRGRCYQGAPSANLHPVTVYDRTRYALGALHHQGVTTTSIGPSFDRGNVVREVNSHGVRPDQETHAGCNGSLNDIGMNTHHKARLTKEHFSSNRETVNRASRSWSAERKRSRPANDFGGNQLQPEVCLKFTKGRCDQGGNCKYLHSFHEYASSISQQSQKPHLEATADFMNIVQANQFAETMGAHMHDTSRDENVSLWSQPFKRQGTWSRRSFSPEDNVHCRTLRRDLDNYHRSRYHHESQNQYPHRRSFKRDGPANRMNNEQHLKLTATFVNPSLHEDNDSFVMASDGHGEVVSHGMQLDQCLSGNPCSETAILSKKNEVESATNALRYIHTDQKAINQEPMKLESTSSFEKHDISEAKAAVVLEKSEMAGVKVDLTHELNEKTEETEHIVKTHSRKKRNKQHPSSYMCDAEFTIEEVTDTSSRSLPISLSMEGASLDHKSVALVTAVSDNIITSVPETNDIGDELANDHLVEEQDVAIKAQKTMVDSLSAATGDGILHGDTKNSLLPASQSSDAAILKCRRKLLVLDVNGLLADIVADFPDRCKPDITVAGKGVFKRPFCDDFLQFCFEKFDVGIWSSRTKKNVTRVLDCLMENTKNKLLFCWHQSHCTQTGYRTVENSDKPLVLKELKKLWEKEENDLPWKKGFYNETNTVLLDDSPYKALRNPPYTAIFPFPYSFRHVEDKSLGPDGELRLYLERLAEAENVQKFIQENPFGQRPITKTNLSWAFYSKIAGEHASQQKAIASSSPDSS